MHGPMKVKRQNTISYFLPLNYFTLYSKQNNVVCCQENYLWLTGFLYKVEESLFAKVKITGWYSKNFWAVGKSMESTTKDLLYGLETWLGSRTSQVALIFTGISFNGCCNSFLLGIKKNLKGTWKRNYYLVKDVCDIYMLY